MSREDEGLKQLGNKTKYSMDYAPGVLETFENKYANEPWKNAKDSLVRATLKDTGVNIQ